MANCSFCERDNIGFMGGYTMTGVPGKICDECHSNLIKLRSSHDEKTEAYFCDIMQRSANSDVRNFLSKEIPGAKVNSLSDDERKELIENRNREINSIILSTTDAINGHSIDSYCDIVTGISVLGTGLFSELDANLSDMFGTSSTSLQNKISFARDNALSALKAEAYRKHCNAVIGVSIAFVPFTGNMIGIVATGTAVTFSS